MQVSLLEGVCYLLCRILSQYSFTICRVQPSQRKSLSPCPLFHCTINFFWLLVNCSSIEMPFKNFNLTDLQNQCFPASRRWKGPCLPCMLTTPFFCHIGSMGTVLQGGNSTRQAQIYSVSVLLLTLKVPGVSEVFVG